ncbi:dienelactone hydrolase [Rhodoferax sp. OV413]|uniref:alpha/beta hydrolase family protein n=1 Tax=Rhodoferax sp. OV413 TaxID=1855285 RepID=UPI00115FEBBE|nr:dienelactone hydrolase [Rhodoferax sp. OV413]
MPLPIILSMHYPPALTRRLLLAMAACTPLGLRAQAAVVADETWTDATRQRALPVKIRWPATPGAVLPVLLYSHGLGGSRDGGAVWGQAWADAGCVVVHLQHPGSDTDAARAAGLNRAALRSLASAEQLRQRLQDVVFVLDEIARRQRAGQGAWARVRPDALGLGGHSFGTHTTLGMAGQSYPGFAGMDEPRLAAFIALSPTLPMAGDATQAFARVTRPLLAVTGTRDDDVADMGATPERRRAVFDALPPGGKALLVLQDADHMTLGGGAGAARRPLMEARRNESTRAQQQRHHALLAQTSTDWWRAHLLGDAAARARMLRPAGLAVGDVWQQK